MGVINQKNKINYNYRYERKFLIDNAVRIEIENIVKNLPGMFIEAYPKRYVNNIYFDTLAMKNYFENVDGSAKRKKARIRWYGNLNCLIHKPMLEIKLKMGLVGGKISHTILPFDFNEKPLPPNLLTTLLKESSVPVEIKADMDMLNPTLVNRYSRSYFQSADKNFRITIDDDLSFFHPYHNRGCLYNNTSNNTVILELKYAQEMDNIVEQISSKLPFRLTKSSKYVEGIGQLSI